MPARVEPAALVGRAVLPAGTLADGPPAGAQLGDRPVHGQRPPFAAQPVQGFSALLDAGGGDILALVDNGFGALENSADFHLRVYTLRLDPRTAAGGSGAVTVRGFFELRDPDHKLDFPIVQHFSADRVLTGADLDVESMQRAPDGTLWFGDEFGPFLLHTSADGVVLEPPIPLPDPDHPDRALRAPQNPYNEEGAALRLMHAFRWRAARRGARTPVVSPHHVLLADGDPAVDHPARGPAIPGLARAASEIFDPKLLRRAGFPVVVWTVNDPARMHALLKLGVDGIISDRPDLLRAAVHAFDGDGDGAPDLIGPDGLVDPAKFDAQGHRGARDLRPENTLPAMEAALDELVTTLETDVGLTRDEVPILGHDPRLDPSHCRRSDGSLLGADDSPRIRDLTRAELQAAFVCDRLSRGPSQTNDRASSPVAVAFARAEGLPDAYTPPTLAQLLRFAAAYADHYTTGPGAAHPEAALRAASARRVRFNVETKLSPRQDHEGETLGPDVFAARVVEVVTAAGLAARVDVQSFDVRTLLRIQDDAPQLRTVFLFGDAPVPLADGANLQDEAGAPSPWLAGLQWPYRVTALTHPFTIPPSGGFEAMALRADPPALLPMLEKPRAGAPAGALEIFEFDLSTRTFTTRRWTYPLDPRGVAVGELQLDASGRGLVIERDGSEADLAGFKAIQSFTLGEPGPVHDKRRLVDLLALADPHGLAPAAPGDLGVGGGTFAFPFLTIESLLVLPGDRLLVANDNNFPFGVGRHTAAQAPDDSEMIVVQLPPTSR